MRSNNLKNPTQQASDTRAAARPISHREQRRQRSRVSKRHSVDQAQVLDSSSEQPHDGQHDDTILWQSPKTCCPRVVVLSGNELFHDDTVSFVPPEPTRPPPIPSQLVSLVILGELQSGKTSLVKQFLHRQCPQVEQATEDSLPNPSHELSSNTWSMDYYKKDISYWHKNDSGVDFPTCTRVQLWDVSGIQAATMNTCSKNKVEHYDGLQKLTSKASGIVLVVSVHQGGYTCLLNKIKTWIVFLHDNLLVASTTTPPVTLFVHKHDLLGLQSQQDPSTWIRLGADVSDQCRDLGIEKWHLTSYQSQSIVQAAFMDIVKRSVPHPKGIVQQHGKHRDGKPIAAARQEQQESGHALVEAQAVPIVSQQYT